MRLWIGLAVRRDGMLPWIALVLLCVAAALHALVLPRLESRNQNLAALLQQAQSSRMPGDHAMAADLSAQGPSKLLRERRDALYAVLTDEGDLPQHLQELFDRGVRHGLVLAQADYRRRHDVAASIGTMEVRLPVRGTYSQVRKFIDDTLHSMPGVALGELRLRRQAEDTALLDAQLHFVVYVREAHR